MSPHQQQFYAIQSMLTAGHRSVRLERHTLLLLGLVGAFLSIVTEWVITDDRFPEVGERGAALLVWLALWLGGASWLEHRLTRRARERRAETLPFAQAQVTRAWWMLLTVGCLGSFAMAFHGGGGMVYALWTVLLGLGVYLYGLFSRPLLEWIGLGLILLGVVGLAAGLPYGATRWLNAACFGIGLPLAGWLNARVTDDELRRRLPALLLWLAAVVTPALAATRLAESAPPEPDQPVLRLPAGAPIPLRIDLESPLVAIAPRDAIAMTLTQPVEIALSDGQPDGRYRLGAGAWHAIRDGVLRLQIDRVTPRLDAGEPEVRLHARFQGAEFDGERP